jgi:hypothetical protein
MSTLVWIAGVLAGMVLVYLVIALLLPERLQ